MSDKLPIVKLAVHVIASLGVSKVINDIIQSNTNVETTADAVRVAAGSVVIGSMIAEHASNHVQARLDALSAWHASRKATEVPTK